MRIRIFRSSWIKGGVVVIALGLVWACGGETNQQPPPPTQQIFEFSSYTEIEQLFADLNYTEENWARGIKAVPRLYLQSIPERWRATTSREVSVRKKKELFFRLLGPLALRANELVLEQRDWVVANRQNPSDPHMLALLDTYRVTDGDIDELLIRVDSVPVSLVLAQAAEESGWGTSRFAALGNALFGQWTYGEGMAPKQRRADKGNYSIAAFDSPLDSVRAYLLNINRHAAYADLRRLRAQARAAEERASGYELANTLLKYSERGQHYVESLHTIIRVNELADADDAYLSPEPPIHLVPKLLPSDGV